MSDLGEWSKHPDPKTVNELLHRLWSKAVGTQDYNKGQWGLLREVLSRGMTPSMEIPEEIRNA